VICQLGQSRVGNRANAHLQSAAVVYKFGYITPNFVFLFCYRRIVVLVNRVVNLYHGMYFRNVNDAVSMGARHLRVDLCHDVFGFVDG
jgi:hypothetical protein